MDDMGGDDAGAGDDMGMDMDSLGLGSDGDDSNLLINGVDEFGNANSSENLQLQTLFALQELGIVIGVAFMVGLIFLVMISLEKVCDEVSIQYRRRWGAGEKNADVEDPAALVGTFKRYKN
eukprot:TRINITY_DN22539_c0_g1_i1.p1 TRINITY_DN22539_c0_g1~~TRINITY_DN22539_c0_g1_i1.p1  ORF type:complete len:121 (-),score=44.75 TRINITY_DN22539_c0_g1_i1:460-822(-)